jgi:hypothetical protein
LPTTDSSSSPIVAFVPPLTHPLSQVARCFLVASSFHGTLRTTSDNRKTVLFGADIRGRVEAEFGADKTRPRRSIGNMGDRSGASKEWREKPRVLRGLYRNRMPTIESIWEICHSQEKKTDF